jgi:hypothetical protein
VHAPANPQRGTDCVTIAQVRTESDITTDCFRLSRTRLLYVGEAMTVAVY